MNSKFPILLLLFCLVIVVNCVEPYTPDIEEYGNLLIVDGLITNKTGPYQVKLARSFDYKGGIPKIETGANVKVIDNYNNEFLFEEIIFGTYQNIDTNFIGVVGNSYKLLITTQDGQEYETEFQDLKSPISIDSIYYKYKSYDNGNIKGIQVYIDSHDPNNNTWYYGWTFEETWEIRTPNFHPVYKRNLNVCYKEGTSTGLMLGTSENNKTDQLKFYPVYYLDYNSSRLKYKYSALIQQYSLSENIYKYLSELKKINEERGSLYDAAPSALRGNVYNINNPIETVLGIFQVSSIAEKRFFVDHDDLPENRLIPDGFEFCEWLKVSPYDTTKVDSLLMEGYIILDEHFDVLPPWLEIITGPVCYDCRETGKIEKPDFWIY